MSNIIIAGGGLMNKGAQAMTVIGICELKRRFPDHRILLLTWDASETAREKHAQYALELLELPPLKFSGAANNPVKRGLYGLRYGETFKNADQVYRNADLFVDISGYALGSNWSAKVCNDYLDCIEHALAYDIPVYLLPQSFGPFDYADDTGKRIDERTRRLLPRVKRIFAREQEGYDALVGRYGLTNVTLTHDMVLASGIEDYSPALREKLIFNLPEISENGVCMIPNFKIENTTSRSIQELYRPIISQCVSRGLSVYISHHSSLDGDLCKQLKEAFADHDRVILLEQDFSCMEFNELVKRFRFVAASRFHAIVHALKNGVPCVALGWADKYRNLMKLFGQEQYVFDLREPLNLPAVEDAVADMTQNWQRERETILSVLPELQKENVFDLIKEA